MDRSKVPATTGTNIPTNIVRPVFVNNTPASTAAAAALNIECRSDSNGHSSPDSGVNDMSDERPTRRDNHGDYSKHPQSAQMSSSAAGDVRVVHQVHHPGQMINTQQQHRHQHKIMLLDHETFRIKNGDMERHINGPANIAMVASNGGPARLPIRAPAGHIVQPIHDDNGVLTQLILRPQHPNMPPMNHGGSGNRMQPPPHNYHYQGSHGPMHNGGGPQPHGQYSYGPPNGPPGSQQGYPPGGQHPLPAGFHPQYHHHPMTGAANLRALMVQQNGGGNNNVPSNGSIDDRLQQKRISREKASQLHSRSRNGPEIIMQQSAYNNRLTPRINNNMNGNSGIHRSMDRLDVNSCSSSTDSHDTVDEEKRLIQEKLSQLRAPQVEVESRRAVVHITPPIIPEALLDPSMNYEVQFQLQYTDKKDGQYKIVYEGDATTIKMQDLKPGNEYYISVCAILDDVTGKHTDPVMFRTNAAPPEAPPTPKLCQRGKAFILLKWNAATDNGAKILNYILEYYKASQNSTPFSECYRGNKKEYKLTKLTPSQEYTFRLAAVNECGQSDWSKEVAIMTNGTAPPQPAPPLLSEATLNSILLTWIKRPGVDKEFVLQQDEENTGHGFLAAYTGPEVSYRVDKLRKSTTYRFRLLSSNEDGRSGWSDVVTYQTKADIPAAPLKLSVKGKVLSSAFKISWEAPRDNGGSEIEAYMAQLDSGSGYHSVYEGASCECSCVNLLPGYTYRARVAARNCVGLGRWSDYTQVTTKPTVPGACSKPWLHGKPKAHSLHLKWAPPENEGGSPVRLYIVQLIKMDNTLREVYKGADTDCVVAGLSPGRSYLLQVRAVNEAGEGDWSETADVLSGAGVPEAPSSPHCTVRSAHSVHVLWNSPCNNGAKISEYRLEYQKPGEHEFSQLFTGPELEYEVKNLHPDSEYSFRVQAVNSSGFSAHSHHSTVRTSPSSPAAVCHVRTSATASSITITWSEPQDHGSEITQYNIEYGKSQSVSVSAVDMESLEYTIEELTPDTIYRIRVQAVNAIGAGAFSSQSKVTTLSLPPSPPCLECASVTWNTIRLRWSESEKCEQYTVMMSRSANGVKQTVYHGSAVQCRITKLHERIDYHFTISAHNSAGEGEQSEPLIVTTTRAPPHSLKAPAVVGKPGEDSCEVSWQTAKPFPGDEIEYRVQLSEQVSKGSSSTHTDYKQVYQGVSTSHRLIGLTPDTTYSVRVCPVRICSDGEDSILGANSPATTFHTEKIQPVRSTSESAELRPDQKSALMCKLHEIFTAMKPEKENQYALGCLLLLLVISVIIAGLLNYWMG